MTSSGLFVMTGVTIISTLASQFARQAGEVEGFVVLFGCFLVVETTTLLVDYATKTMRHASFLEQLFSDCKQMFGSKLVPGVAGSTGTTKYW